MSNPVKILLPVVALVVVLATGFVTYTFRHWWYWVGTAEAHSPSGRVDSVPVYRSTDGEFLFIVVADSLGGYYIFYPSTGQIGKAIGSPFRFHVKGLAYSEEVPVPVKIETDMNIVVDNKRIEFDALGRRVKAELNNF